MSKSLKYYKPYILRISIILTGCWDKSGLVLCLLLYSCRIKLTFTLSEFCNLCIISYSSRAQIVSFNPHSKSIKQILLHLGYSWKNLLHLRVKGSELTYLNSSFWDETELVTKHVTPTSTDKTTKIESPEDPCTSKLLLPQQHKSHIRLETITSINP